MHTRHLVKRVIQKYGNRHMFVAIIVSAASSGALGIPRVRRVLLMHRLPRTSLWRRRLGVASQR